MIRVLYYNPMFLLSSGCRQKKISSQLSVVDDDGDDLDDLVSD